jgi:hypothetical protein
MDRRLNEWKVTADRLWSASAFDHRAAVLLVSQIARESPDGSLQHIAAQALPSIRAACAGGSGEPTKQLAQRRFGTVRDCLHTLSRPNFGKRGIGSPADEARYRQMLGLPLAGRLYGPEINRAYKAAAKKLHPDMGGDKNSFLDLRAARDTLMKDHVAASPDRE